MGCPPIFLWRHVCSPFSTWLVFLSASLRWMGDILLLPSAVLPQCRLHRGSQWGLFLSRRVPLCVWGAVCVPWVHSGGCGEGRHALSSSAGPEALFPPGVLATKVTVTLGAPVSSGWADGGRFVFSFDPAPKERAIKQINLVIKNLGWEGHCFHWL